MGKSNRYVFPAYMRVIGNNDTDGVDFSGVRSIAFLGFPKEDEITSRLPAGTRDFYDLSLDNWNINDVRWDLKQDTYDMIVCTRCAYFAKDAGFFLRQCSNHLNPEGYLFVDWGLGDHWRFENYKVGWVRDGEHEHAYADDNFLHSCYWRPDFEAHPPVHMFWEYARETGGYDGDVWLSEVVRQEVPSIVSSPPLQLEIVDEQFLFLWPDAPQLYVIQLFRKG